MKERIKSLVGSAVKQAIKEQQLAELPDASWQHQLAWQYATNPGPGFNASGFQVFSQDDEDGKLLYIFSQIGTTNKKCVDIAFASPIGSNTANLIVYHGWHGFLVEGGDMATACQYFHGNRRTNIFPPVMKQAWITTENVNNLILEAGFQGEIDLFSLDIDGIDYWLWKALDAVSPRVMVVEYQDILGPDLAVTVPYKPDFNRMDLHEDFYGASLPAFVKLAKEKGYRLVGANRLQYNAFFVRNDIVSEHLPEVDINTCFTHPKVEEGRKTRFAKVKDLGWEHV
ncbi:MAG: hypothetical protein KDD36_10305 [Flavobacteriales bacterium]|nr:hypothetical protein [Flavobacteriales bacterium]